MRQTKFTTRFRRDYRREKSGQYARDLDQRLDKLLDLLERDEVLPPQFRDHALTGNWKDHRDCHIRPDLVLIYRKPDNKTLELVRLGSHRELGI